MPSENAHFLHPLFGDHMVLQQGHLVPIWGWVDPGQKVSVKFSNLCACSNAGSDGKWMVCFANLTAGGPYEMTIMNETGRTLILRDIYVGEVWLCSGQSNMDQRVANLGFYWCGVENESEEIATANYPLIRQFANRLQLSDHPLLIPANQATQHSDPRCLPNSGQWQVCSPATVGKFSATAYFFAREFYRLTKLPIGLILSCYGGSTAQAWISRTALQANPILKHLHLEYEKRCLDYTNGTLYRIYAKNLKIWKRNRTINHIKQVVQPPHLRRRPNEPKDPRADQHSPSVMYNGMISPLIPYAIKGVIWNHGESNQLTAELYFDLLSTLIADWRNAWGVNIAFLIVQLHNLNEANKLPIGRERIPLVREAQLQAMTLNNTALVVTIDLGQSDVHLRKKQPLGERLAKAAMCVAYSQPGQYQGPVFQRMIREGARVRLYFSHAEGLHANGPLNAFIVAGADGKYHWAHAEIEDNTIVISSPQVPDPIAVRYAWADNPIANLYNEHGLPASPFRSDININSRII